MSANFRDNYVQFCRKCGEVNHRVPHDMYFHHFNCGGDVHWCIADDLTHEKWDAFSDEERAAFRDEIKKDNEKFSAYGDSYRDHYMQICDECDLIDYKIPTDSRGFHLGCGGGIHWGTAYRMTHDKWDSMSEREKDKLKKIIYEKNEKDREFVAESRAQRAAEARARIPRCPNCQSTNIRPISSSSRVISTLIFGIASNKIGKSYECANCKYTW